MKTQTKIANDWKPAFAPWRFIPGDGGETHEVWTAFDRAAGSRNNYAVATGIQDRNEGQLMAAAPELLEACELALRNLAPAYSSSHLCIVKLVSAITKAKGEL